MAPLPPFEVEKVGQSGAGLALPIESEQLS